MMLKKDSVYTTKGRILFYVGLILIFVILHLHTTQNINHLARVGVWSYMTVDEIDLAYRSGLSVGFHYTFRGYHHEAGTHFGMEKLGRNEVGARFFIQIDPNDTNEELVHSERVPEWFTLEAPPEGWPTKPTEVELREMMVQDSLRRGLK